MNIGTSDTICVQEASDWHAKSVDDTCAGLQSSLEGIDSAEAVKRLARYGLNRIQKRQRTPAFIRLLRQLHDPLIYVLLDSDRNRTSS